MKELELPFCSMTRDQAFKIAREFLEDMPYQLEFNIKLDKFGAHCAGDTIMLKSGQKSANYKIDEISDLTKCPVNPLLRVSVTKTAGRENEKPQ